MPHIIEGGNILATVREIAEPGRPFGGQVLSRLITKDLEITIKLDTDLARVLAEGLLQAAMDVESAKKA